MKYIFIILLFSTLGATAQNKFMGFGNTSTAAVNLFSNGKDFTVTATWFQSRVFVTGNVTTDPGGGTTADNIYETTETGTHYIFENSIALVSGNSYTVSIDAKIAGRDTMSITIFSGAAYTGSNVFDVNAGTVVSSITGCTNSITPLGSGWYKCSTTFTANSTGNKSIGFSLGNGNTSYTGDGTSGVYLWDATCYKN